MINHRSIFYGFYKDSLYICRLTEGYSGSDITALAKDAALGPIRGMSVHYPSTCGIAYDTLIYLYCSTNDLF